MRVKDLVGRYPGIRAQRRHGSTAPLCCTRHDTPTSQSARCASRRPRDRTVGRQHHSVGRTSPFRRRRTRHRGGARAGSNREAASPGERHRRRDGIAAPAWKSYDHALVEPANAPLGLRPRRPPLPSLRHYDPGPAKGRIRAAHLLVSRLPEDSIGTPPLVGAAAANTR